MNVRGCVIHYTSAADYSRRGSADFQPLRIAWLIWNHQLCPFTENGVCNQCASLPRLGRYGTINFTAQNLLTVSSFFCTTGVCTGSKQASVHLHLRHRCRTNGYQSGPFFLKIRNSDSDGFCNHSLNLPSTFLEKLCHSSAAAPRIR